MTLKALIVDDEYPARKELRHMLEQIEGIEVLGEAADAREAKKLVSAVDYAVIFLDINMPGMSGLELSQALQGEERAPYIIFVTAFEEHAVQAFEVNAVDYLLKPIDKKRLQQALDKVFLLMEGNQAVARPGLRKQKSLLEPSIIDRIPVDKEGKTLLIPQEDIVYIFTQKNNVYIRSYQNTYCTRFTLKDLEERLKGKNFFRTHRCYIVNLTKVNEIIPFFNGTYTLIVDDCKRSEVPVSRNQARKLKTILGL